MINRKLRQRRKRKARRQRETWAFQAAARRRKARFMAKWRELKGLTPGEEIIEGLKDAVTMAKEMSA